VLIAGSPVIFPNEKLPLLLEASGLALVDTVNALSAHLEMSVPKLPRFGGVVGLLLQMAQSRLPQDASGAWTVNHGLLNELKHKLDSLRVDGVVYHVLKGQIELDFELPRIEALCERYGIPVFRLETDYQQQDVEQLRIRMEAFAEMLRQQNMEGMRIAL
jgi:benzoyl-CoA reductase/2-hydroxyglutaryl-CoA dehydratase subunit BcrC/BadD/HgdB